MIDIPFHIAYLLTKHECVIVPDLGAFIVSLNEENYVGKESLSLSSYILGFNSDIKHNDGLLASFISSKGNISYNEACLRIGRYVEFVKKQLWEGRIIQILRVGKLQLSPDEKIVFIPSFNLSCNAGNFGFNEFYIPSLFELAELNTDIAKEYVTKEKTIVLPLKRRKIVKVASVAAAVLTLFLVSTPLNENLISRPQQASFITLPKNTRDLQDKKEVDIYKNATEEVAQDKSRVEESPRKVSGRSYYIIISSLPTNETAQQKAEEYRQKKFPKADVITSEGKNRVYVDKFTDKEEAEKYLQNFRKENPDHVKAWLLSQRN
ncbi:MAG: SPOR domain-containing protein [Bacteroidales bacterium]|nr:SPOR domain-containing protein [Bacteroidales bacterium]